MPYCEDDRCFQVGSICEQCNHTFCARCAPNLHNQACSGCAASTTATMAITENKNSGFAWESLFPGLISSDGMCKPVNEVLGNAEVVGVYFSAHWCPPCRGFKPELADIYKQLHATGKKFEIVFVSSDKDEHSFKEYHSSMPWLALPFQFRQEKQTLSEKFKIEGIPTLILLSSQGEILTSEGRELIDSFKADGFPFTKTHLENLEKKRDSEKNELLKSIMGQDLKLFGESAWGPHDSRVRLVDVAKKDVIALVFGDRESDVMNQHILPMLTTVYGDVRSKFGENAFEVIVVPWDGEADEEEDKAFRKDLPFLSLDYSSITPDVREQCLRLFDDEIQVPFLALISGNGSEVLRASALREVYETKTEGYPWTRQALKNLEEKKAKEKLEQFEKLRNFQLFENKLIQKTPASSSSASSTTTDTVTTPSSPATNTPVSAQILTNNKIVGLYFSAHWCGPCRAFTPRLISVYNELKQQQQQNFEIIFISSDRDQKSFESYYGSMPWLALAFEERALKSSLSEMFEVEGIPTLKFLDGSGKLLEIDGRSAVMMGAEFFPWDTAQQKRFSEVAKARDAELKVQAQQAEARALEEQKAKGNGVFERLRGKSGVTTIGADHKISFGSFDTVGAPSNFVTQGKVFYEVEIIDIDEGIQQFGWADQGFEKTDGPTGEGVGDDKHSYGADGTRVQRWHDGSTEYGLPWSVGDTLGCAADLDEGTISFGLNGNWEMPMGVAFEKITPQGGLYPALTANSGVFLVNLGGRPFKFGPPSDKSYVAVVRKM